MRDCRLCVFLAFIVINLFPITQCIIFVGILNSYCFMLQYYLYFNYFILAVGIGIFVLLCIYYQYMGVWLVVARCAECS